MSANWTFTLKAKNEKTRNPVSGEFFASDAIKNAGEALIREAIQNSLDARPDRPNGQAQVRIYVSGSAKALPPSAHQKWFGSAWSHYLAPKNGLRPGKATRDKKCGFLVFEDFGTTGLIGDWEQTDVIEGAKNAFFYFFRAEGATEKSADQLGRWGIGKQVFPRSSHAQTLFGYSVTKEHPNGFLMGSCILKYHEVDRKVYRPDGYFSKPIKLEGGDQISGPITDESLLADFRGDFNLSRKNGQPGLSVVVPWLDEGEEGSSGFDQDSLLIAILDGYYLPILEGKLEVALEDEDGVIRIKADNFHKILSDLAARLKADDRRQKLLNRTRALVRLAQSMMESTPVTYVLPDCDATKAVWAEGMLPEELGKSIRTSLAEGRLVQVKAALTVRSKDKPDVRDEFSCFMIKDEAFNDRPCHIREDLIISNVTSSRANGFATIVRIDKGALANLLGDSENPAHTEWQPSSQNFKDKYVYGGMAIKFVADFATELLRRVHSSSNQIDKDILRSYFNDPGPETPDVEKPPRKEPKTPDDQPGPIPPVPPELPELPPKAEVRIVPLADGFTAMATGWPVDSGANVEILAAYETAKGDPFSRYQEYDFDFKGKALKREIDGATIVSAEGNRIVISITEPIFQVTVKGFDVNRDLVVRSRILETKEAL